MKLFADKVRTSYLVLFVFAFALYANSIKNKYALDDEMVTLNNPRVEMGIKGIPKILRSFHSIDNKSHYEYRPLVLITFALEYQFFGRNPYLSHLINILLYAFTCVLIFYFLKNHVKFISWYSLPQKKPPGEPGILFALFITLLFTAHPLHTEVVDNLKSRDELLSMLFSLLASLSFLNYADEAKKSQLFSGFLFFFLAMLSKKSAAVFIVIIPLLLYFLKDFSWKKLGAITCLGVAAILFYIGFKNAMLSEKPLRAFQYFENPLFFERGLTNSIPAGLYTLWKYIELLVFPHPLSYYYGYNQVPVAGWNNPKVWISLVFHAGIFFLAIKWFKAKHILSLAILFYLVALFPFSNIVIPAVGIIGERFAYVSSLGFCIATAYLLMKLFRIPLEVIEKKSMEGSKWPSPFFTLTGLVILALYSFKTITRNHDWKDHLTLYRHDIKHLGNSAKAHAMISNTIYPDLFKMPAGIQKNNLINECIFHYKKALEIYPDYTVSNNNIGSIYFTFLGDFNTALPYFKRAVQLDSNYLEAYYNLAYTYEKLGMPDSAVLNFEKVLTIKPTYVQAYERMNSIYFSTGNFDQAIELNLRAAGVMPEYGAMYFVNAGNMYSAKHDTLRALNYFIKAFEKEPQNKDLCIHIARVYEKTRNQQKAEEYFRKAEELK